ncbi:hypothetical protein [Gordonia terrae]
MNMDIRRVREFEPIKRIGPPTVELAEGSLTEIRFRQNVGGRLPTRWVQVFNDALSEIRGVPALVLEETESGSVVVVGQFSHQGLEPAVAAVDAAIEAANTQYLATGLKEDKRWLERRDELKESLAERVSSADAATEPDRRQATVARSWPAVASVTANTDQQHQRVNLRRCGRSKILVPTKRPGRDSSTTSW